MKIGAGNAVIHFPEGMFPLEGFKGIHDEPKVSLVVIEAGSRMAIASAELVMMPDDFLDAIRKNISDKLDVAFEQVWIHTTHAITTPHAPGGPLIGLGGNIIKEDPNFPIDVNEASKKRKLYEKAVGEAFDIAMEAALKSVEAKLFISSGEAPFIEGRDIETPEGYWIGRHGDGITNQTMTILDFKDLSGKPVAMMISYGMKPCVIDNSEMDKGNRLVSSDAPGRMCRILEEKFGAPVLYFMAAAGDRIPVETVWYDELQTDGSIKTIDLGVEEGLKAVEKIGDQIADATLEIIKSEVCEEVTSLKYGEDSFEWETKGRIPMHPYKDIKFEAERKASVPVAALTFGNVALVAGKPEINTATEKELADGSSFEHTLYISMVNGGMKYMPDIKAYNELRWEALTSMLMPGAAEEFVGRALALLKK